MDIPQQFSVKQWSEKYLFTLKQYDDVILYLENIRIMVKKLASIVMNAPDIKIYPMKTQQGNQIPLIVYNQMTLPVVMRQIAYEEKTIKEIPCLGHLFTREFEDKLDSIIEILKVAPKVKKEEVENTEIKSASPFAKSPGLFYKHPIEMKYEDYVYCRNQYNIVVERNRVLESENKSVQSENIKLKDTDAHLQRIHELQDEIEKIKRELMKKEEELKEHADDYLKVERYKSEIAQRDTKIANIVCLFLNDVAYFEKTGFSNKDVTEENIFQYISTYTRTMSSCLHEIGETTINDYKRVIGENFDYFNGLIYKYTKENKDNTGLLSTLKQLCLNKDDSLEELARRWDIFTTDIDIILAGLKKKLKKGGMFIRRVGPFTEYIGMVDDIVYEKEVLEKEISKLKRIIGELMGKIKEDRKNYMRSNLPSLMKEWANIENDNCDILGVLKYKRLKLYRRKIVNDCFGPLNYKENMRYAGIVINRWRFDYLCSKSLGSVINKPVETLNSPLEMKLSIKCLRTLGKVMDTRRALVWARNYFAKKLGREQIPRSNDVVQNNLRFLRTYYFEDDYTKQVEETKVMSMKEFIARFLKYLKQIDHELNSNIISRAYCPNTKVANDMTSARKDALTAWSAFSNKDFQNIPRNLLVEYKPRRDPVAAYRKFRYIVEQQYNHLNAKMKMDLLAFVEESIPKLTYDRDDVNDPPEKYINFCENAISRYKYGRKPEGIDKLYFEMDKHYKYFKDALNEPKKRNPGTNTKEDEKLEESSSDSDYSSDEYDYSEDIRRKLSSDDEIDWPDMV